jgi:predicted nucleic acid-binding protein
MIVFDASVLIALGRPSDAHHSRALDLVDEHEWDEFAVSAVTLSEVLVRPVRDGYADRVQRAVADLGVAVLPFGQSAAPWLAHVRANTTLRLPDAVVLHTAEDQRALIATFDTKLTQAAAARGIPPARVVGPPFARRPSAPGRSAER